ncbi:hypothetical protein LTR84_003343 [Exophiala bonariae]|uniref:Zn(2)-C6 fungal-type domain-containing protein n=1 Tax=Exophiala bonariae TaxID=1690606 RepID=A0AAV9NAQ5_9EURO|nr:hypothetical protein LTR84_003343 [Exophiala bonariae]
MVYPGHPSRGCFACRRKKVKCDETKPQCNRCTRVGKVCPGYRSESEISFKYVKIRERDHSDAANHHTNQNEGALILPIYGPLSDDDSSSSPSHRTRESSSETIDMPFFQPLQQPWTHLALPLFINLFTTSLGRDSKQGLLTFLPRLYRGSTSDSPLQLAVSAATDANAVRKLTDHEAIFQARRSHVQALVAVQKAIENPKTATNDTTLCSLFILTLFEYISGDTMIAHGSHIAGYEALLDLRSRDIDSESQEYALDLAVATQIVVKHMRTRTLPSPRTIEIFETLNKYDPSTVVVQINLKVIQFNNYSDTVLERTEHTEVETQAVDLHDLIMLGERIDDQAHIWPGTDESLYLYQTVNAPLSGWARPFYVYETLAVANDWNLVRCARISLSLSIIKCCRSLFKTGYMHLEADNALQRAKSTITTMLEDIVASFPYCLGKGDAKWNLPVSGIGTSGFALLWPIGVLLRCGYATPEQIESALQMLDYIGGPLGLQRAIVLKQAWASGDFR